VGVQNKGEEREKESKGMNNERQDGFRGGERREEPRKRDEDMKR
jgi:hypothetical protein